LTGSAALDGVTVKDNTVSSNTSNSNLQLSGNGTGKVEIMDGITGSFDITQTGNTTITGQADIDYVRIKDNKITTNASNSVLEISANGSGTVDVQNAMTTLGQTVTGNVAITGRADVDNLRIDANSITAQNSNGGITLNPNGTGTVTINGTFVGITNTLSANKVETDQIAIEGNEITTANSNANLELSANGSGKVTISGLSYPTSDGTNGQVLTTNGSGVLTFTDKTTDTTDVVSDTTPQLGGDLDVNGQKIISARSNEQIILDPNGTGTIELAANTNVTGNLDVTGEITKTGDLKFNASGDILIDGDGGDIFFMDGSAGSYASFSRSGSRDLTLRSNNVVALTFDSANVAAAGNLSVAGSSTLDGVTITDNTIKANASNADLQIGTAGTGVIDILTATQATVGSAGGASALPGQPTGYIKVKIGGTMRVIPFYDES
jgi:hypothetical protein